MHVLRSIGAAATLLFASAATASDEIQTLTLPTPSRFGQAVAGSGDVAVASENGAGRVQIYRRSGSTLVAEQLLSHPYYEAFGTSVAIDGDTIAVASPSYSPVLNSQGAIFVYRWNGTTFALEQTVVASDARIQNQLGFTGVAISGNVLVAGCLGNYTPGPAFCNAAYVFRRSGATWVQEQKIVLPDGVGPLGQDAPYYTGYQVAVSGDTIVLSRMISGYTGGPYYLPGAAFVYRFNGSSWQLEQKLESPTPDGRLDFGESVAVDGDLVLVGEPAQDYESPPISNGAVYFFRRTGTTWALEQKIVGAPRDRLGFSVDVAGDTALVGAPAQDLTGSPNGPGSAYLYRRVAGTWTQQDHFNVASTPNTLQLGWSVALMPDLALAGAPATPVTVQFPGVVFSFDASICGNGTKGPSEQCDDGNTTAGDGCSAICQLEPCNDTIDNDGDGLVDFPADPGCRNAGSVENPKCQNGLDDDGDGKIDFDGGASTHSGIPIGTADPECTTAWRTTEARSCGIGAELTLVFAALTAARRRRIGHR